MLFYHTILSQNFDVFLFLIVWILQINHLAKYRSTVNAFYGRLKIRFTPPWNHTNQIPQIFWQNSHTIANKEQYQQNLQQLSIFSHIIVLHDNKYIILLLRISEFGLLFKFKLNLHKTNNSTSPTGGSYLHMLMNGTGILLCGICSH